MQLCIILFNVLIHFIALTGWRYFTCIQCLLDHLCACMWKIPFRCFCLRFDKWWYDWLSVMQWKISIYLWTLHQWCYLNRGKHNCAVFGYGASITKCVSLIDRVIIWNVSTEKGKQCLYVATASYTNQIHLKWGQCNFSYQLKKGKNKN